MDKKARMEALARQAFERGSFNGTWLCAEGGEIVSKGALGWRDLENKEPLADDCVFDLASVTKQFTATAVMLLRREGLLDLDDEITKFFPAIPYKGVTIRHLLHHTGGLPDYMSWVDKTARAEGTIPDNSVIVRFLCECGEPAVFAPGEKWEYSNTGYCLLAQIVEELSGVPFEDFLRTRLFEPAGMEATRVWHRRMDKCTIPNLAWGLVLPLGSREYVLADEDEDSGEVVTCDGANGDGLVHSNIFDLFAWDRALREEKILTKDEQRLLYTPGRLNNGAVSGDPEDEDGDAYGLGWFVAEDPDLGLVVCHSGGWPGYGAWYERFIDKDRVLILLRCRDTLDPKAFDGFFDGMRAVARDKEPEPIRTLEELAVQDPDRSGWPALCGKYDYHVTDEDFHIDEIFLRDGDLYAKTRYKEKSCELKLWPMEEKVFAVRDFSSNLSFIDDGLTLWGVTGKKL